VQIGDMQSIFGRGEAQLLEIIYGCIDG